MIRMEDAWLTLYSRIIHYLILDEQMFGNCYLLYIFMECLFVWIRDMEVGN